MSGSVMIKGLEFYWAKLGTAVAPFGTLQWEVQVRTTDKDTAQQLKDAGVNVKTQEIDGDTVYVGALKRKAVDKKGKEMSPPRVVDGAKAPLDGDSIGNGSKGNVILFSYDYNVAGRSGTSAMITAVQVTELVKYSGSSDVDFDVEDTIEITGSSDESGLDFG